MKKLPIIALILISVVVVLAGFYLYPLYKGVRPLISSQKATPQAIQVFLGNDEVLPEGEQTQPVSFRLNPIAFDLGDPRDITVTAKDTLLVSVPKKGRVVAIFSSSQSAYEVKTIVSSDEKPHGLVLFNEKLLLATEVGVYRYTWNEEQKTATLEKKLFSLPKGGRHTSRTLAVKKDGTLFVSLGSTCDVCKEKEPFIGTVIRSTVDGATPTIYSTGLRNAVFLAFDPTQEHLFATEMGRDMLGDELPPDEINILNEGNDYGWPVCYGNRVFDVKNGVGGNASDCEATVPAAYEIPAHSAPLGLTFVASSQLPPSWQGDLLVAYHGSWNRSDPAGYKVVRLSIDGTRIGKESDVLRFIENGVSTGRPVDLAFDSKGNLFVTDDGKGVVYHVEID